jgi:hypothetical protein
MKSLMSSILKHRSIGRMLISLSNNDLPKHGFGLPQLVQQVCHEDPPDKEVDEQEVTKEDYENGDVLPVLIVEAIKGHRVRLTRC